jgi:hypothetical protein
MPASVKFSVVVCPWPDHRRSRQRNHDQGSRQPTKDNRSHCTAAPQRHPGITGARTDTTMPTTCPYYTGMLVNNHLRTMSQRLAQWRRDAPWREEQEPDDHTRTYQQELGQDREGLSSPTSPSHRALDHSGRENPSLLTCYPAPKTI